MSARLMPAMSDGRAFTSYVSAGQVEATLQERLGVVNENQYRSYLQHNAGRVADELRRIQVVGALPPIPPRRPH